MSKTRVRDARPLPTVCVARQDLAVLGERVEPRRLAPVRSTYLGLIELAGDPEGWTKGQLAARAGIGTVLLNDCLGVLERSGLIRVLEDGSYQLSAPSGDVALPVVAEPDLRVVPPPPDLLGERADAMFRWHAGRIGKQTGSAPSRCPAALAAARRILKREPDGTRIKAVVEWALSERFFADKVVTWQRLDQWWGRICLGFDAAQGKERPEQRGGGWASVSYDSDRVQVA
jgi:hypothetical protein